MLARFQDGTVGAAVGFHKPGAGRDSAGSRDRRAFCAGIMIWTAVSTLDVVARDRTPTKVRRDEYAARLANCACNADVVAPFAGLPDFADVIAVTQCANNGICNCTPTCDVTCDGSVNQADIDAAVCRFQNQPPAVCCPKPQPLTREQAVNALLDPGSGVPIDTDVSTVWSPFVDFGFGATFEGMVSAGSTAEPPYESLIGDPVTAPFDAYFFWIDDNYKAEYSHGTRFVWIRAIGATPTVANGGILVSDQSWWPVLTAGGPPTPYFEADTDRQTNDPPGFDNVDGLVAGFAYPPSVLTTGSDDSAAGGLRSVLPPNQPNACGIIVRAGSNAYMGTNATKFRNDLINRQGVPAERITTVNNGDPATEQQFCDALDNLSNQNAPNPPCDKIYIRWTGHGGCDKNNKGTLGMKNSTLTAAELCAKLKTLGQQTGAPVCMLISACHSEKMLEGAGTTWTLPAGSSVIASCAKNDTAYGGPHNDKEDGTGNNFDESAYTYAFSQCLNDNAADTGANGNGDGIVSDDEAYRWVIAQKPCYKSRPKNTYPGGGAPNGAPAGDVSTPKRATFETPPKAINVNVKNQTGGPKTDFHMIFKGDVRGGVGKAWRSNANDQIGGRWADGNGQPTITYNDAKNETMVCWDAPTDPVANGQYIHFGYTVTSGGLRQVRQYWTPTPAQPADGDKVPTKKSETTPTETGHGEKVHSETQSVERDGWGEPLFVQMFYRISPVPIPLDNLNLGDPMVQSLPAIPLGVFSMQPDVQREDVLSIPDDIAIGEVLILESHVTWSLNGNTADELVAFDPLGAATVEPLTKGADDLCVGGTNVDLPCAQHADCPGGLCHLKNRFITAVAPISATSNGIKVNIVSVDPNSAAVPANYNGTDRWVGPPQLNVSDGVSPPFNAGKLQCAYFSLDWSEIGQLHVFGDIVVPASLYDVSSCNPQTTCSTTLRIGTARWGDVRTPLGVGQPNFQDISSVVSKFQGTPAGPSKTRTKLAEPVSPATNINFQEVSADVSAFQGKTYKQVFPAAPSTCP